MPINNNLFGVYKSFKISGNRVVADNLQRNRQMQASPVNYVQGTPKARVMDIQGVTETLSLTAPIFVGCGSSVDGRFLANTKINEILSPSTAKLPLLTNATFNIGEQQSSVSITLESDGDPNNSTAFEIRSDEVPELSPIAPYGPTRLAKFYDIRVQIGQRKFFVMSATITVQAQSTKANFFIPGDWGDYRGWGVYGGTGSTQLTLVNEDLSARTGTGVTFQPGTQFPFLGISSIQITGSGKAAVLLEDLNTDNDFTDVNESINLSLQTGTTDMTLQNPGFADTEAQNFVIEIYDPVWAAGGGAGVGWSSLLPGTINLTKSIVNTSNFSLGTGLLTVDFGFLCYVA
jgi:hypothetical protein